MKRCHRMPFGATPLAQDAVAFRLWAPAARQVALCLPAQGRERELSMAAEGDGWFALETDAATPGSRYVYRIDDDLLVPDPASRFQPEDVTGPSQVIDPLAWSWRDADWRGRPWHEAVLYELHVGTFSAEGSFDGVRERLDYLLELGVTAIELMPVADFPGARNWGYDGVLPFAPDSSYGRPEDLKALVEAAHLKGMMVLLDVVYNHFGPQGNFLHAYAPAFFSQRHHTPWGAAINFDGPDSDMVRRFFIHNALYWLEEYHFDGLRLDAVHAIMDDSPLSILEELAAAVREGPGRHRHVHLVLENDHNASHYLERDGPDRPRAYVAQWNDDVHHALHVLLTGEEDGYYADYAERPHWYLGRCLAEGFAYQGESSRYRGGAHRGEPSAGLPATAFVSFLQNHDQIGNRAFGERIASLVDGAPLRAVLSILLLAPSSPLLFMGEEFAAATPFRFFCDFSGELAQAVTHGRRREFARFARFADPAVRERIPDPNAATTFTGCRLDWSCLEREFHADWLAFYRRLLLRRQQRIVPRLAALPGGGGEFRVLGEGGLRVQWRLVDGATLVMLANLAPQELSLASGMDAAMEVVHCHPDDLTTALATRRLPPWSVAWLVQESSP